MRRIVLTGGPYSGKTTLVARLEARGFAVAHEAALKLIESLAQELGAEGAAAWRDHNPRAFQERIASLQIELEEEAAAAGSGPVICDRGILDGIAYCRMRGVAPPERLAPALLRERYRGVLLLDTLDGFRARRHTGRLDDRSESLELQSLIREVYREHGYDPVEVPELPLEERLARVLRAIEALGS